MVDAPTRLAAAPLAPEWEQPEDAQAFWMRDRMHFPEQMTALDEALSRELALGFNGAAEQYSLPARMHVRRFFTYYYDSMIPLPLAPDQLAELSQRSQAAFGAALGTIEQRWNLDLLPEILGHLAFWQDFDLPGASFPALQAHLEQTIERSRRLWTIHFEIGMPAYGAMSAFDDFFRDLFPGEDAFAAYKLLQGFDNKTLQVDRALWSLSRRACQSSIVAAVLAAHPAPDVIPALRASEDGREFLADLDEFLAHYGRRGNSWGLTHRSWIEDPTPVITNLKDYVAQPDRDPLAELAALASERQQHVAAARAMLEHYPEPVRQQFEFLLHAAQVGVVISEDHGFYIDFQSVYEVRRIFLELGRRFVSAGVIAQPEDILHLTLAEVRTIADELPPRSLQALVAARKAELEQFRDITPPPAVGTPPPPGIAPDPVMLKFFGAPPMESADANELRGAAGSPGVVRGRVKVVKSLTDAGKLQAGDILVAETTAPPWTPLFASVAAVVTDTGGVLSHCAVVAREYRIPAVVGTGLATATLLDGQLVEVDGDHGIVRIIEVT